ncbi:MAG: metalloregulator ArsR/SmtB family transcription factor [Candidatus Aerophobetes bacterium]|nr:metalloregulator ArsR/SmtB family transcription factor [Candidatus Aerophobetes bacterium]
MLPSELEEITKVCKALSDPTRLRIFLFLARETFCVNAIVSFLDISQSAVSQHLKILREAELVKVEKRGCWMHYSANLKKAGEFADTISKIAEEEKKSGRKL